MTEQTPELVPHYALKEAAARFFPDSPNITARSLCTEIRKGNLRPSRVAGKYVVSAEAIEDMLLRSAEAIEKELESAACPEN